MARFTTVQSIIAGSRPIEPVHQARRERPSIDLERVRISWDRAHRHFSARQAQDLQSLADGFAPGAIVYDALLGELRGRQIEQAARGHARQTTSRSLRFQVENAAANAAKVNWTACYDFRPTGRRVEIDGTTRLLFSLQGIERQIEDFDLGHWSRQTFGLKGRILGWLPGWRSFVATEVRLAYGIVHHDH